VISEQISDMHKDMVASFQSAMVHVSQQTCFNRLSKYEEKVVTGMARLMDYKKHQKSSAKLKELHK